MIKKNLKQLIITSALILLPILLGLLLWSSLPAEMPIHWNAAGEIDRYCNKAFAVFGFPLFLLVLHWLCILATHTDRMNANQNRQPMTMAFWVCPITSIVIFGLMYTIAMGYQLNITNAMLLIVGAVFVVVGNFLPKCRQNHTIGIKLPWTLSNEDNWNKTHRLGGKVWVLGGFILMLCILLPAKWNVLYVLLVTAILVLIPTIYSYRLSKQ